MAWSFRRNEGRKSREQSLRDQRLAPPDVDETAFINPNYRRGGPWSAQALPTYSDSLRDDHELSERPSHPLTAVQQSLPYGTYPPAGEPPDKWNGYKLDNWIRSQDQEHVLDSDEGQVFGAEIPRQRRMHPALNPYWYINIPDRIQRAPDHYSFLRRFDQGVLGKRRLSGDHFSQGQMATDNHRTALQGMVPSMRRRSTFRMEPIPYGEDTVTVVDNSGFVPASEIVTSPRYDEPTNRSFRLG